jgi:hypothetical protein
MFRLIIIMLLSFTSGALFANRSEIIRSGSAAASTIEPYVPPRIPAVLNIRHAPLQYYAGLAGSYGITTLSGDFESVSRNRYNNGRSQGYDLILGVIPFTYSAFELSFGQHEYNAAINRFYADYATRTEYRITMREYALSHRLLLGRYYLRTGVVYFTPAGTWQSQTEVSSSITMRDPVGKKQNTWGGVAALGHSFRLYRGLTLSAELYGKFPFAEQWKGSDRFRMHSAGLQMSLGYLFP